ncbi:hypothetical protein C8E95_4686 [Pseudonocardia autotrophica]|uniref:Pentalenene oxygenase n=1 Tax=Pseudonocardia autotrophica TaxID=2074 RepID=A0A1Y2MU08_PSEAH|nr:Pentalenene oxygenase [Pseudonocardia autotrophica]TDN75510.1 hypothetical protein C8E95_4686 [Pseudonocardia autotrophica]
MMQSVSRRVREAVDLAVSPRESLDVRYRRFGPVSSAGFGPLRVVWLLGPEANRFVFAHSELFGWREAFDPLVVVDGETALIVSDGADHERRRRLVMPAFTRHAIDGYAEIIRSNVDAAIDTWQPGQVLNLYTEMRRVIRRSTIATLFGPRLAEEEPELGRLLQHALAVVDRLAPWQQLQRLGAPSWRRAVASRAEVAARVQAEIERRRREPDADAYDVLARLMNSQDGDRSGLHDVEIVDQVISLIAAGYETTSAAAAWAMHALITDPQLARRVSAAAEDTGRSLTRPAEWRCVDGLVSEVLRLHPPAVLTARKVLESFEFDGVQVPARSTLLISPYLTHRLPELWPRPLQLDPDRWNPTAPDHRRPGPHEFLPFGGGSHRCIGAAFATVELTVLLECVARRVTLSPEPSDMTPVGLAAMRPRRGPFARVVAVDR